MFHTILIANRGEIACRIIKTCRNLGVETVAIYSSADKMSPHVRLADRAMWVGEAKAQESYLNIDTIIDAAKRSNAEAIHPGYGFLSENPLFAEACERANLVFIGPSVSAMEAMASKQLAKQMLEKTTVPLIPGYHGSDQSDERLLMEALQIGFPVLLKAARGGGGKGMRAVYREADFFEALASARRESMASFADDTMLIEKLVQNPRHVEVQIMADDYGSVVHLFERDCSLQRRHQKIIEEAPAPNLSDALRQRLFHAASEVARSIHYRGAGTVEFLLDDDESHFYFMEMNTRLQVEHPVTEMITGLDLVEWQLKIAANEPLPCLQNDIIAQGHAIECRIYAEDPHHDFVPSIGKLQVLKEPRGEGIRVDSGVRVDGIVTLHYDPMLAKLIAWGHDRDEALQRLRWALDHYVIGGVKTNLSFLQAICSHPRFIDAKLSTDFLTEEAITLSSPDRHLALWMAASYDYLALQQEENDPIDKQTFAWQMHLSSHWTSRYLIEGELEEVIVTPISVDSFVLKSNHERIVLRAHLIDDELIVDDGSQLFRAWVDNQRKLFLYFKEGPIAVERFSWQQMDTQSTQKGQLTAPMPATVVAILKNVGDNVVAGESLLVLEAMKMEHTIHAPKDGVLAELFYGVGSQVDEGAELLTLKE